MRRIVGLIDLNATQAAIRAGYSRKTAEQQGSRLLINVKVSSAISERMKVRENLRKPEVASAIAAQMPRNAQVASAIERGEVRSWWLLFAHSVPSLFPFPSATASTGFLSS